MAAPPTIRTLRRRADAFVKCRGRTDLGRLLRTDGYKLAVLAEDPKYDTFRIPKKKAGTFRLVEDPRDDLKFVQRRLNAYLQAVYYFHRTPAAYGFITNPADATDRRTIKTNAERHIGARWLMNVDMRDFFHLIDEQAVRELFRGPLLKFRNNLARTLAALCTYHDRLPMGAPTSPVLSNLYSIPLDSDLQSFADARAWTYTRYADDMTFSSTGSPIRFEAIGTVNEWVKAYDLQLNPNKSVIYGPGYAAKEVTGLIVDDTGVRLSVDYVDSLREGIRQLDRVINTKYCMPSGRLRKTQWVEDMKEQLRGRLAFASQILEEDDPLRVELETAYAAAVDPPTEYGAVSWLHFGYTLYDQPRL